MMPEGIMSIFNNDPRVIDLGARYLRIVLYSYIFTGITFVYTFSLKSIGNTVKPMIISAAALTFNVFLNYVFIFGAFGAPAMGVEGSALATLIARVIETVSLVLSIYIKKEVLAASIAELTNLTFEFIKKSYRTILPVILNDICWGLATLVYSAVYGRIGTHAVASIQICNTVINLFMVVMFGMSDAAAVMVGNAIGAGREDMGKEYSKRFSVLAVVTGIILGLLLMISTPLLLDLFNVSPEVRSDSQIILYIVSGILFIRLYDVMIIIGILRGGGDAKYAFLAEGFTMWFIGVPLTIIGAFVLHLPVYAVYALAIVEEIAKCLLGIMRLKSGKWIRNVTHNMAH
jgi:putative MATE family efflux protein